MNVSCSRETSLPTENSIVLGSPAAEHKIIVFFDPDNPICSSFHQEMEKVVAQRSDIAFYIKFFPLPWTYPDSERKSRIIACADSNESALAMLKEARSWGSYLPEPSCDSDMVDRNMELAESLDLPGTPAIAFSGKDIVYGRARDLAIMAVVDGNARVEDHRIIMK